MTADDEVTEQERNQLRLAYRRAFNEYSEASYAIDDRLRRRSLPTAQEFARRRAAHSALLDASLAVWKVCDPSD
jgi:hypothetical protein